MTTPLSSLRPKPLSLALQGGGTHGAFTWGVLDRLLQEDGLVLDSVSGASAGAVNAVALAHGLHGTPTGQAPSAEHRQAARQTLRRIWEGVTQLGSLGGLTQGLAQWMLGCWTPPPHPLGAPMLQSMQSALAPWWSPAQMNPLDFNPLRRLLEQEIDFERLQGADALRVHVSATQVNTGRAEVFSGPRLNLAAVLASTCLPTVFQAVEIDGQPFWDGGYAANPALRPLIREGSACDILVVQINPSQRRAAPQNQTDIVDRIGELGFNASLLAQWQGIEFVNRLIDRGQLREGHGYKRLHLHRIEGGEALEALPAASKMAADGALIGHLFTLGEQAATRWLASPAAARFSARPADTAP